MSHTPTRILALDPFTRGFGYVLFELPFRVAEWGIARAKKDKLRRALSAFAKLLEEFQPDAVVLEDAEAAGSRRRNRVRALLGELAKLAKARGIAVYRIARTAVERCFTPTGRVLSKIARAEKLAEYFPDLAREVPHPRKAYDAEHERTSIFDALALAVTHVTTDRAL